MKNMKRHIPIDLQTKHDRMIEILEKGMYERAEESLMTCNNYMKIDPQVIFHRVGHDSPSNFPVAKLWQFLINNHKGKVQHSLNELVRLVDYDNQIIQEAMSISDNTKYESSDILTNLYDMSSTHTKFTEFDNENVHVTFSFLSLLAYIVKDTSFDMPSNVKNEIQLRHMRFLLN